MTKKWLQVIAGLKTTQLGLFGNPALGKYWTEHMMGYGCVKCWVVVFKSSIVYKLLYCWLKMVWKLKIAHIITISNSKIKKLTLIVKQEHPLTKYKTN